MSRDYRKGTHVLFIVLTMSRWPTFANAVTATTTRFHLIAIQTPTMLTQKSISYNKAIALMRSTADSSRRLALIAAATRYPEICSEICCEVLHLYPSPEPLPDTRLNFLIPNTVTDLQRTLDWMSTRKHQQLMQFIVDIKKSARTIIIRVLESPVSDTQASSVHRRWRQELALKLRTKSIQTPKSNQFIVNDTSDIFKLPDKLLCGIIAYLAPHHLRSLRASSTRFKNVIYNAYVGNETCVRLALIRQFPYSVLALCKSALWRRMTDEILLEIPRIKPLYTHTRQGWNKPLPEQADEDTSYLQDEVFSLALSVITTLPKAKRITFVHNILAVNNTNMGTDKSGKRSKFAKEFRHELKEVLLDNIEDGLVGHLTEAYATRDTDKVDHYVLY